MPINRRERRTLIIIAGIVAAIALIALSMTTVRFVQDQYRRSLEQPYNKVYPLRTTAVLDAEKDAQDLVNGESYGPRFGWTGSLEITVEDAAVYETFKDSGLDIEHCDPWFAEHGAEGHRMLVCRVRIKNIDAVSTSESREGHPWFNISMLASDPYGEICYFDGTPDDAVPGDVWRFDLQPGEERIYTVGYALSRASGTDLAKINLHITNGSANDSANDKHRFLLAAQPE